MCGTETLYAPLAPSRHLTDWKTAEMVLAEERRERRETKDAPFDDFISVTLTRRELGVDDAPEVAVGCLCFLFFSAIQLTRSHFIPKEGHA